MDASQCTVVCVGASVERLFAGQDPVRAHARSPGPDATEDLVALLRPVGEQRTVAVVGGWIGEEAMRRVHAARTLLDTARVAVHVTDLPPLATGVLAALAGALTARLEQPGELTAALEALEREIVVLAWVGSVSRLKRPAPTLTQHARSLVPGGGFGVGLRPDEFVRPARDPEPPPLVRQRTPMQLVVAVQERGDPEWILDRANPTLGPLPVLEVEATTEGPGWWGTPKLVEAVAAPTDLAALVASCVPSGLRPCHWCEEALADFRTCRFCGDSALARSR